MWYSDWDLSQINKWVKASFGPSWLDNFESFGCIQFAAGLQRRPGG